MYVRRREERREYWRGRDEGSMNAMKGSLSMSIIPEIRFKSKGIYNRQTRMYSIERRSRLRE
eukprot:1132073-Amorphochlora_amoeboformis.AAC.1